MVEVTRWIWADRSLWARVFRFALLPPSLVYRWVMATRARAYRARLLPSAIPLVPTISIGNLTVGGSGKTPLASWVAEFYAARGLRPGIVLRGYGEDEGDVHRERVPEAIVVEHPDRAVGAGKAVSRGAQVIVLDDAFQRLDIGRDLDVAVVSAESSRAARWTLPAGPWREGWAALRRADLVVVTRKRADRATALAVAHRIHETAPAARLAMARLGIVGFHSLISEQRFPAEVLSGGRVLASAGIADPDAFADQCEQLGAQVRLVRFSDHHRYADSDVRRLLHAASQVDYVVVTQKDAVKLRHRWPATAPEPLVAQLGVFWERGRAAVETALNAAVSDVAELLNSE